MTAAAQLGLGGGGDQAGRRIGTCRSCRAPVRWSTTNAGKPTPLDAKPCAEGNVVLVDVAGGIEVAVTLSGDTLERVRALEQLYLSHFATCPNRAHHRRVNAPTSRSV